MLARPADEIDHADVIVTGNDLALFAAMLRGRALASVRAAPALLYRLAEALPAARDYPLEEFNDYLRTYPERARGAAETLAYFDPPAAARRAACPVAVASRASPRVAPQARYPNGVRVNYAWIDVRQVREFKQEFACFGDDTRVTITFPSPFLKSAPTLVTVQGMEPPPDPPAPYGRAGDEPGWQDPGPAHWEKRVTASHEEAFKREWIHFHACITRGVAPLAGPEEARDDTAFVIEWARATRER